MKKYKIIGYIKNSMMNFESTANTKKQAAQFGAMMLDLENVYKVEIKEETISEVITKEEKDC